MPIKRCKRCLCLSEESSFKFYIRIKTGFETPYFCRKCDPQKEIRKQKREIDKKIQKERNANLEIERFSDLLEEEVYKQELKRKDKIKKYNNSEKSKESTRRYFGRDLGLGSQSVSQFNRRIRKKKIHPVALLSDEQKIEIGRFIRKKPIGYEIDHIIPLCLGGKHEISNLQYLSIEDHRKKTSLELKELAKLRKKEMDASKSIRKRVSKIKVSTEKTRKRHKYMILRRLIV